MKPLKKIAVLFFSFLLFIPTSQAQEQGGPKLWSLSDDDTTIYIMGTIHILTKDVDWFRPGIKEAFEGSEALILELGPEQEDPAIIQPLIVKYGLLKGGETLKTLLSKEDYIRLSKALTGLGTPGNALDTLQPWLAATFLTVQVAANHGFLPQYGVEKILEKSAKKRGIPIQGLETAEYQIAILASLSPENQNIYLSLTLDELDLVEDIFIEMRDAWVAGDTETLDALINQGTEEIPGFAEAILYQRNRNWVGDLTELLEVPGQYFVAVGTGHLVGANNLIALLREAGFEVTVD
ncbi:MAG: TraB/GumN family protein [Sphingomonadales bacterium]